MPIPIRACAEFPNDNEELHDGTVWVCEHPRAQPRAVMRARSTRRIAGATGAVGPSAARASEGQFACGDASSEELIQRGIGPLELHSGADPFIEELSRLTQPLATRDSALAVELPPDDSRWSELVAIVSDYLLSLGQSRASALLPGLLNGDAVDLSRLSETVRARLAQDQIACCQGARVTSSASFRDSVAMFREEFVSGGLSASEALFWLAQVLVALTEHGFEPSDFEHALTSLGLVELIDRAA